MLPIYLGWLAIISLITAVAYVRDKRAARRGGRRTRERTLLLLNLLGGAFGAWPAFFAVRHKTRHPSFWIVQSLSTILHLGILFWLLQRA